MLLLLSGKRNEVWGMATRQHDLSKTIVQVELNFRKVYDRGRSCRVFQRKIRRVFPT